MEVTGPGRRVLVRRRRGVRRAPVRLGLAVAPLAGLSGTAAAHGTAGAGGAPVALPVVVGLPVLAGLAGGAAAARYWHAEGPTGDADHPAATRGRSAATRGRSAATRGRSAADAGPPAADAGGPTANAEHPTGNSGQPTAAHRGVGPDAVLVVLGLTLALSAVARNPSLGAVGGTVGAAAALWATTRSGAAGRRGRHAGLTLGAVCGHRSVEGVVVGTLSAAGAAVGLLGAVVVAGHAAVETAAVAGLAGPSRRRAAAAVALVQVGYVAGAVLGVGVASAVPAPVRTVALALAGGVLLAVGATGPEHPAPRGRPAARP